MVWDHRKPAETGKSGKITYPDTRRRTIKIDGGEYAPPSGNAGLRTTPQGTIQRFDPATGVQTTQEAAEFSVHQFFEPQNPTGISATATGSTTVEIGGTVDTGGNDGVEIHKSTTQGGPYTLDSTVEETGFPATVSGLTAGTTYYFVVRAVLWDGEKKDASFTAEVSATTGAGGAAPSAVSPPPTISEISRTATTMTLEATWTDVADETSYEWWAGSNDGTTWSDGSSGTPNTLAANSTSVQFVAARTNADHSGFFCIRPCNGSGCAEQTCNGFTVAGNLTAPTGLAAVNPVGSDVDLDWTDMAGASVADVTAIERRLVGGSFTEIDTVAFGVTHYDDNGLADGDYEYRIRHRDTGTGDVSPYSASASVGVNSGGGGSAYPNEPAGLTVVARQGWGNSTVSSPAVESDFTNPEVGDGRVRTSTLNNMEIVSDGTAPAGSGKVFRGKHPDGLAGGTSPWRFDLWDAIFGNPSTQQQYDEIYTSIWWKIEGADYEQHPVDTKGYLIGYGIDSRHNDASYNLATCTFGEQSICSSLFFHSKISENTPDDTSAFTHDPIDFTRHFTVGDWHQVECYWKISDLDVANGVFKAWIDGNLTHDINDLPLRSTLNPNAFYHIQWTPVWGGGSGPVKTRDDFFRIAEFYISGKASP